MKKYDIKNTDIETLKKWYHLMTLGRALDEKAPSYLLESLGSVPLLPGYADCAFCRNDCRRNYPEWYIESD